MIIKQFLLIILISNKCNSHTFIQNESQQNCSFENTINITEFPKLENGSYIYRNGNDSITLIPPTLVSSYDYEIFYDGSVEPVTPHVRACLCYWKNCITLCSDNILEVYQEVLRLDDKNGMLLFDINVTLENGTVVTKNIVQDFEHIVLKEFCEPFYRLSPERDEEMGWSLFENGSLLRHSDHVYLSKNEYCFEVYEDEFNGDSYFLINPLNCAKIRAELKSIDILNNWTQVFSIPFFLLTILAYGCLPELRNIHGKCFMSYLICLTLSYSLLSYINLSGATFEKGSCIFMGYLNHFMQLSHYTWLGIISFDTWKSFSDMTYKSRYLKYFLYGWLTPLLLTLITYLAQYLNIDEKFKPGITEHRCGLEVNKWSATIYLYGPCLIILILCLISFILTSRTLKSHKKEVNRFTEMRYDSPQIRYTLYLRLFLMMGLSWFLDVLSYLFTMLGMMSISSVIDFINAIQGLYIFINFIGRQRVRDIIKQRFCTDVKNTT